MKEKLRLVKEFGELRAGDRTVDMDCVCRRWHEATCMELVEVKYDGGRDGHAWRMDPDCGDYEPDMFTGIGASDVAANRIFVVDDGIDGRREETTSRPLEDAR